MSKNFELLQRSKTRSSPQPLSTGREISSYVAATMRKPGERDNDNENNWERIWLVLRKHWRRSAVFTAVVMGSVMLFTATATPIYEPSARLEIDPPGAELFRLDGNGSAVPDAEYLETQARELEGDGLALAVIRKLDLTHNRQFMSRGLLSRAAGAVSRSLSGGRRSVHYGAGSAITLTPEESNAVQRFAKDLKVKRDTASRLVTVQFASSDPVLSASVTNALLDLFLERSFQTRHEAIMRSTEWLSRQLDDIRSKTEQSNRALADFQRANGIVDVDRDRSTIGDQMAELGREKLAAAGERIQLGAYLAKVRKGDASALPQVQSNPVVQQLAQKLAETRASLAQASAVLGHNHPKVQELQNGVDELQAQLHLQRGAILAQLQTSYAAALSREHMIGAEMQGASKQLSQMAEYTALKREAQNNTDLYNTLYARIKDAGIAAAAKSSNARIIDQARVLNTPTKPNVPLNLGLGFLAALVGAVILPFLSERIHLTLHNPEDVHRWTGLPSPTVTVVPLAAGQARAGELRRLLPANKKAAGNQRPAKFLLQEPESPQAEALRGLETAVMFSNPSGAPKVLLVASSVPGEGKTTVAINLAIGLAQHGRTCIIDADLRQSKVAAAFEIQESTGLAQYLAGSVTLDSIASLAPAVADLAVIAAGTRMQDAGTLIRSGRMRELIQSLRRQYDYLVIDSPPILLYADGRALAPFVDGIVFVARVGEVNRDAMVRSMELLNQVPSAPIVQVVVNGADEVAPSYANYYRASKAS